MTPGTITPGEALARPAPAQPQGPGGSKKPRKRRMKWGNEACLMGKCNLSTLSNNSCNKSDHLTIALA